jgi:hypothetical protein
MKKQLLLSLTFITFKSLAQGPPPPPPATCPNVSIPFPANAYSGTSICNSFTNTVSTNPAAPINCLPQGRKNIYFNWFSQSTEKMNTACKPNTTLFNPTYQPNNPKVLPLVNIAETMKPKDGWELLDRNLGLDDADVNLNNANLQSNDLYFCLYNKRLGVIRFFYAINDLFCEPTLFNGSDIRLTVIGGNVNTGAQSLAPSILDLAGKLKPLDMPFEPLYTFDRVDDLIRTSYNWFYADFPVVYDPCVCLYSSKLLFDVKTVSSATISLAGSINGNIVEQLPNNGAVVNKNETNSKYSLSNLGAAGSKAYDSFKSNKDTRDKVFTGLDDVFKLDTAKKRTTKNSFLQFIVAMENNKFVKGALDAVPYASAALSLFDFFLGGGKDKDPAPVPKQEPLKMALDASIKLSGSSIVAVTRRSITMHVPGSNLVAQNGDLSLKQPFYNAPLGVFNLMTTPKFAAKSEITETSVVVPCGSCLDGQRETITTIETEKYILTNPLKYVVNPHTDLVINDAQMALVFEVDSINYDKAKLNISLEPETKNAVTNKFKFRTKYFNVNCLNKTGVAVSKKTIVTGGGGSGSGVSFPGPQYLPGNPVGVKLMITFKHRSDTNIQNSIYLVTYPIEVLPALVNTNYSPTVCDPNFFTQITKADLTTFCNSNAYTANRAIKPSKQDSLNNDSNNIKINRSKNNYNYFFSLTPNPASGNTLLTIESFEKESTDIYITDVYGKIVGYVVKSQILEVGKSEIDINLSGLQKGMYIIHVQSNELHQKAKLIVE